MSFTNPLSKHMNLFFSSKHISAILKIPVRVVENIFPSQNILNLSKHFKIFRKTSVSSEVTNVVQLAWESQAEL